MQRKKLDDLYFKALKWLMTKQKTSLFDIPGTNDEFQQTRPLGESPTQDHKRCQLLFKSELLSQNSINKVLTRFNM